MSSTTNWADKMASFPSILNNGSAIVHKGIPVLLAFIALSAHSQDALQPITAKSTITEFSLQCQHPAMKSHPAERLSLCLTYVSSAVHQIALAKRSPKCWHEIDEGAAAPGPLMDVMFYLATQPNEKSRAVGEAIRETVVEVAAKSCK